MSDRIEVVKAVMLEVDPALVEKRRRRGLDHFDEMWEGVLHMAPAPGREHQRILGELLGFLIPLLRRTGRGTVWPGINVFDGSSSLEDYRIPDVTFVAAGRETLLAEDGIRGGGPDAVIEIRSPGDESYEKLPFFARLGIREVVIIDRDTKRVEIFRLLGGRYEPTAPEPDGSLLSETLVVRFRLASAASALTLSDGADPSVYTQI